MSLDFESGSSEWVNIGNNLATLQNVGGGTVTAWLIPESTSGSDPRVIFATSTGTSTTSSRIQIYGTAASPSIYACGGRRLDADGFSQVTGSNVSTGALIHIAGVFDFTNSVLVWYENGSPVASDTPSWGGNTSNTAGQRTAISARDDGGGSEWYDGRMQDVRVYNVALSQAEVETIYAARGHDNVLRGLQHRWKMMELGPGSAASLASSIRDTCIGARNGTPGNTPTYREAVVSVRRRRRAA